MGSFPQMIKDPMLKNIIPQDSWQIALILIEREIQTFQECRNVSNYLQILQWVRMDLARYGKNLKYQEAKPGQYDEGSKIVFLDIDGVANSEETLKKSNGGIVGIDPYMAFLIGKIQLETDCKFVLSSSWRHHPESVKNVEARIAPLLDCTGREPLDPSRPPGVGNCQRGREIQAWLDNHPEVKKYAIIDDDNDMLPEQQANFFKTQWKVGMTEEIMQSVIEHLNK